MKSIYITLILAFIGTPYSISQDKDQANFPEDFYGIYTGNLKITSLKGEQDVAMEFHLQPTDLLGQYEYRLVYGLENNRQERKYTLKEKNRKQGVYVVDENNGIILDDKLVDNKLYALFEVGGNLLTTFISFEEDHLIFEIVFAPKNLKNVSYGDDKDKTEVVSYPITTIQRAVLKKL